MRTFEKEVAHERSPKKHFYGMPQGIASFTDEQLDAFAENLYDQMVRDLGIEGTPKLLKPLASAIKIMGASHE